MTPLPGCMPPDADDVRLRLLGFSPRLDPCADYVRYRIGLTGCSIVYASHLPIPWGVAWGDGAADGGMAWCRELEKALRLWRRLSS